MVRAGRPSNTHLEMGEMQKRLGNHERDKQILVVSALLKSSPR